MKQLKDYKKDIMDEVKYLTFEVGANSDHSREANVEEIIESTIKAVLDSVALEETKVPIETALRFRDSDMDASMDSLRIESYNQAVQEQRKLHEEVME